MGARDRVGGGRARNHQARGCEYALLMRRLDGLVDLRRDAEIIRGDDESFQSASPDRRLAPLDRTAGLCVFTGNGAVLMRDRIRVSLARHPI